MTWKNVTIVLIGLLTPCQGLPHPDRLASPSGTEIEDHWIVTAVTEADESVPRGDSAAPPPATEEVSQEEEPAESNTATDEPIDAETAPDDELISEPLLVPILSSDPKIATAAGLMAAYAHQFDEDSPTSLFGAVGAYSTTDSYYYGLFVNSFFAQDKHRIKTAAIKGVIKNDFDDFLGTGLPAQTTDDAFLYGIRYLGKVSGPWYIGAQGVYTNYVISGDDALSQGILDLAGLTGLDDVGIGLAGQYDTRDNQNSPREGKAFELHNLAYRKAFGGDHDFDVVRGAAQFYLPHGRANTTAMQIKGRWTDDAPPSGYSSVDLRGYVRGQFLAEHSTLFEVDERIMLSDCCWGVAAFTGIAVLYGEGSQDELSDNLYPNIGAGVFYQITEDRMVIRGDIAFGKDGNRAFYLNFNQPF